MQFSNIWKQKINSVCINITSIFLRKHDYNELMKKVSESFRDMHENSVQYYKQKANEELDKMEKNIQSGNKLSAINEKLLADTYLSFAITI
jgi:uncharacterized protein (UPF0305 family)